ncbi:MAG: hypothetical protein K9G47_09090, partial [Bacteroidales bacterium]|nr:hypothetical protein [Bacteroidales bacterium]
TAAEKWNVLPANILFEILSANPDELGDEEFLDYLANKPDPLPEYMIDMLRDTIGVETYKTILRSELGHYSLGRQDAANKLIANELADTASASLDTLRYWLNEKNGMGSRFSIVDSYLHENNLVSASDELNSIPGMIELSDWEAREYNYFVFLKNLLISLKNNNKTIFDIDSIQKLSLDTIADSSHFIAGAQARGVLNFVFNEDSLLIPFLPDTSLFKNSPVNFGDQGYNKNEELFRVIPNPARDWISIEYKLSGEIAGATIEMLNQMGIKIREIEVFKNRGIKNMNIEDVLPGTYLFLCKVNGKIIGNQKIIVIK